jgi:hypothetical protein
MGLLSRRTAAMVAAPVLALGITIGAAGTAAAAPTDMGAFSESYGGPDHGAGRDASHGVDLVGGGDRGPDHGGDHDRSYDTDHGSGHE